MLHGLCLFCDAMNAYGNFVSVVHQAMQWDFTSSYKYKWIIAGENYLMNDETEQEPVQNWKWMQQAMHRSFTAV